LVEIIFGRENVDQAYLEQIFNAYDRNNDGFLQVNEFYLFLKDMKPEIDETEASLVFSWFDINLDGIIDKNEFL
jgi:Ca2+-binding EF-hand superfamily protein